MICYHEYWVYWKRSRGYPFQRSPSCHPPVTETVTDPARRRISLRTRAAPGCPATRQPIRTLRWDPTANSRRTIHKAKRIKTSWVTKGAPLSQRNSARNRFAGGWPEETIGNWFTATRHRLPRKASTPGPRAVLCRAVLANEGRGSLERWLGGASTWRARSISFHRKVRKCSGNCKTCHEDAE